MTYKLFPFISIKIVYYNNYLQYSILKQCILSIVNKVQPPYRAPPKNTVVGNRGETGKIEELSAQVYYTQFIHLILIIISFNNYLYYIII